MGCYGHPQVVKDLIESNEVEKQTLMSQSSTRIEGEEEEEEGPGLNFKQFEAVMGLVQVCSACVFFWHQINNHEKMTTLIGR